MRSVLLEAVRATDEVLRGLDRAERNTPPDDRAEIDRVRFEVCQAARMILESQLGVVESETGRDGHSRRVGIIAAAIAGAMGLPQEEVRRIEEVSRLHNVGELALEWAPLARPEALALGARHALRRHPSIGERLLPTLGFDAEACRVVGAHHERLDGSGYPDHIEGDRVPVGAQILAVADSFEALTHPRPHRPALATPEAVRHLSTEAFEGRLSATAVAALQSLYEDIE